MSAKVTDAIKAREAAREQPKPAAPTEKAKPAPTPDKADKADKVSD